jgi:hypothetical protein
MRLAFDNAFFILECRRARRAMLARRLYTCGAWLLVMALPLLWAIREELRDSHVASISPFWLIVPHAALTITVAYGAGQAIIRDEARRGMLETLLLTPYSAPHWLAAKSVSALWWTFIAWLAGLPVYVCAAVLGLLPHSDALAWSLFPAYTGVLALAASLIRLQDRVVDEWTPVEIETYFRGTVRFLGVLALTLTLPVLWGRGPAATVQLFGVVLPGLPVVAAVTLAIITTAVMGAIAGISGDPKDMTRGRWVWLIGVLLVTLLCLGRFWSFLPWWGAWIVSAVAAGIASIVLSATRAMWYPPLRKPTPEVTAPEVDTASEVATRPDPVLVSPPPSSKSDEVRAREQAWLADRWPNPMLLRELRSRSRRPLRGELFGALRGAAVTAGVVWLVLNAPWLGFMTAWILFAPLQRLSAAGQEAHKRWKLESDRGTLELLCLAPLTSVELLTGRMGAAALYSLAGALPGLLLILIVAVWVSMQWWTGALPAAVVFLSCTLVDWISKGFDLRQKRPFWIITWPDVVQFLALLASGGIVVGSSWLPWPVAAALALPAAALQLIPAHAYFSRRLAELDALRTDYAAVSGERSS